MKHPYHDILVAIAEGKEIQWSPSSGHWVDINQDTMLEWLSRNAYQVGRYRIKPATITINCVECEAPIKASGSAAWIRLTTFETETMLHFANQAARDAAYAALIKPFESDK